MVYDRYCSLQRQHLLLLTGAAVPLAVGRDPNKKDSPVNPISGGNNYIFTVDKLLVYMLKYIYSKWGRWYLIGEEENA